MERVRAVTHYIIFPADLADTPIPMKRFEYQPTDKEGKPVGELSHYTVNQLAPNARRSVDGTKVIFGIELNNLFEAIAELNNFPDKDKLQVLSHKEAVEAMKSPEWTAEEVVK